MEKKTTFIKTKAETDLEIIYDTITFEISIGSYQTNANKTIIEELIIEEKIEGSIIK